MFTTPLAPSSVNGAVTTSFTDTGASFTQVTFTVTVAVSHNAGSGVPLSHTWYVKVSTPQKLAFGV